MNPKIIGHELRRKFRVSLKEAVVFSTVKENCDITANVTVAHLIHCWMIFLFTANIQVYERCSEDVRSMAEASVNFRYIATLCCKT